jgi:hypothetical protein
MGEKFTVPHSILLNTRECSPLGVNKGVNIPPLGTNFTPALVDRGEVKNGPLSGTCCVAFVIVALASSDSLKVTSVSSGEKRLPDESGATKKSQPNLTHLVVEQNCGKVLQHEVAPRGEVWPLGGEHCPLLRRIEWPKDVLHN